MQRSSRAARILFSALWGRRLNRMGVSLVEVHGLRSATVWDGAEERFVRFYFTHQKLPASQLPPAIEEVHLPEKLAGEPGPSTRAQPEYLLIDSRAPYASAIGISMLLTQAKVVSRSPVIDIRPPGLTNAPFPKPYLAD